MKLSLDNLYHLSIDLSNYQSIYLSYLLGSSKQQEVLPPAPPLPAWSRGSHGADDDGNPREVVVLVVMVAS